MTRTALIATLPKSGTWYMLLFFWTYNWLHTRRYRHYLFDVRPDIIRRVLGQGKKNGYNSMPDRHKCRGSLGISSLYIVHSICPGYYSVDDPLRAEWDKLSFFLPYNGGEERMKDDFQKLDPRINPDARIVYIHRNPLDHFASYFRVTQVHEWEYQRLRKDEAGNIVPIRTIQEFVFKGSALHSYIKQFHTFKVMQKHYPENVLMIPYETLTRNPRQAIESIIEHLGCHVKGKYARKAFETAFELSRKENVMSIESTMNRSLSGRLGSNERHVAGGKIGQWCDRFSQEDLDRIETELNRFGLSLNDYCLVATDRLGEPRNVA